MCGDHDWFDGDGFGLGWVFPALIVGKVISDVFERSQTPTPPFRPQTPPSQPQARPANPEPQAAAVRCQNCNNPVNAGFAYCPHCGVRLTPPTCRYCGQLLKPEMRYCARCGGPVKH